MNNRKPGGLHPNSQRLLWALVYNQRQTFDDMKPYEQLEQRGLFQRLGTAYMAGEQWEATPLGIAELQAYAPFLKRIGLNCPPNN